jgi:hypothetical protein
MPFPKELQDIWDVLWQELVHLHFTWNNYREVFATSPEQIDVLNRCAPHFFFVVQRALLSDTQLSLARLGDPAENRHQRNATLASLLQASAELDPQYPLKEWSAALTEYEACCEAIRKRRNKQIAHLDLAATMAAYNRGADKDLLAGPSRKEIEDALASLRRLMDLIQVHFENSTTTYTLGFEGGGKALVSILNEYIGKHDEARMWDAKP